MDLGTLSSATLIPDFPSNSSLANVKPDCDAFGKKHCSYNVWSAWLLFGLGLLLVFTNARNMTVLVYIMRRKWVNTDAICLAISILNVLHGMVIVTRSITRSLHNLWPFSQFEVHFCVF